MPSALRFFRLRDDRGATAIEYALIAGLVSVAIVGSLVSTKGSLNSTFGKASSQMAAGGTQASGPTAYDFASQAVTQTRTFTGSTYGLKSGQVQTVMNTANGYITYANKAGGGSEQMSLFDSRINNGQTVYYTGPANAGDPEKITASRRDAQGTYFEAVTTIQSDGSALTAYRMLDANNNPIPASTYTATGIRSDFDYILNQIPVAKAKAGY